ncbi:hypothetical protein FMZ73_07335 [Salmonella enterica subsp. enterica]|nr:hypothetical protein [Salmonella enterica subsp. enterica serovar Nigeria]ECJ1028187.1 hypothetical protein [Salmonella enterica subsp. enterica serovar Nigeria]EDG1633142.1 hypothetical protein [Salmonella enterica subsp. enterica serovar Nigeria]EGM6703096.1 hypothetical protein [Salmonella enterica subsp. enterica serovar Nigeria]
MFDIQDVSNAILVATTSAFINQTSFAILAGETTPEAVEIPAYDFTLTENEQTGGYSLVSPYFTAPHPFELDRTESLYSMDNMLKIVGAGMAIYASYQ